MITITRIQTRPNIDTLFFFETNLVSKEYAEHLKIKYKDTGKLIGGNRVMSDDKLTLTTDTVWESQEAFAEFYSDPVCIDQFLKISADYEQAHEIKTQSLGDTGFVRPTWKQIDASEYFKDIVIPDDWDSLEDFVDWYCDQRMPLMIPWNANVIRSDDAVAICLFKKGHYQVEFYIEYPQMYIYKHSHPRMEVITMTMGGGGTWSPVSNSKTNTSHTWGGLTSKLINGNYHGGDLQSGTGNGFVILAFQKWEKIEEMTSAAVQWKGELQGEWQAQLIKSHYPDAFIRNGYADISRKMS